MTSKIKVTFLGTAGQMPSARRNHSSMLLSYEGENILVDCGEGTQRQFRKAHLNPCKVTRILITHWHGDHVFGLPGFLSTLALSGYNKTLYLYGPRGTKSFMNDLLKIFKFTREYKIEVKEVGDTQGRTPKNIQKNIFTRGKFLDMKDFYLEAEKMEHGIPTNAYCFVKKGLIRIDKKKLKKFKIGSGIHLKKLKEGKDISYEGKKYKAKDLTFKDEDKKVCFVLDTKKNARIVGFAKNSDVLVCESSFGEELLEKAKEHLHLTSGQAADIAKKAKVGKLVLTHIGGRYENNPKQLEKEARKIFKKTDVMNDFDEVCLE